MRQCTSNEGHVHKTLMDTNQPPRNPVALPGGHQKKNSWYHCGSFFSGVPPEGEGGMKKKLRKFFQAQKDEIS